MTKSQQMPDRVFSLAEHLDELRRRIIYCLLFVSAGIIAGFVASPKILAVLKYPSRNLIKYLIITKPTDAVIIYFKIGLYCGLIISLPYVIYQIWQFVKPAAREIAVGHAFVWIASILSLFVAGTIFVYFILLPYALEFLMKLSGEIAFVMISLNSYISFVLAMLLAGGLIFELPVLCAFLTKLGLITPGLMKKKWKEAVFAMVVFAAVITPTTDVFNLLLFLIPMVLLYAVSIVVSGFVVEPKKVEVYNGNGTADR